MMSLIQNRIINAVQPKSAATAKTTIQTSATAGTSDLANSLAPPNMIPRPAMVVIPSTMLGTANLTGATDTSCVFVVGRERLAPQRLQYFSSTAISFPHDGQYIENLLVW